VISIVIPTFNRADLLAETLRSVQAQTLTAWEAVVVDDGSTDETVEAVERLASADPRFRLVRSAHGGPARARNLGYRSTDPASEAVIFLDSDDVWEPDALQTLSAALAANPGAVAVQCLAFIIDELGHRLGPCEPWMVDRPTVVGDRVETVPADAPTTFFAMSVRNCVQTTGVLLIRRQALEKTTLFDESMKLLSDHDMWWRLLLVGDFAFAPRPLLGYRRHGGNISAHDEGVRHYSMKARRKMASSSDLTPQQRKAVVVGYRYMQKVVARRRLDWAWTYLGRGRPDRAAKQLRHACIAALNGLGLTLRDPLRA